MRPLLPYLRGAVCAFLLLSAAAEIPLAAKGWETVRTERTDAKSIHRDSEVEIKAARGVLVVSSGHAVQIKIFTILGSLIANDTLQPGTYQFAVPAHGVYIVKVGDMTCKVAL